MEGGTCSTDWVVERRIGREEEIRILRVSLSLSFYYPEWNLLCWWLNGYDDERIAGSNGICLTSWWWGNHFKSIWGIRLCCTCHILQTQHFHDRSSHHNGSEDILLIESHARLHIVQVEYRVFWVIMMFTVTIRFPLFIGQVLRWETFLFVEIHTSVSHDSHGPSFFLISMFLIN